MTATNNESLDSSASRQSLVLQAGSFIALALITNLLGIAYTDIITQASVQEAIGFSELFIFAGASLLVWFINYEGLKSVTHSSERVVVTLSALLMFTFVFTFGAKVELYSMTYVYYYATTVVVLLTLLYTSKRLVKSSK